MPSINSPTPDATTTTSGKVTLKNNLSGTATNPSVVSLTMSTQADGSNTAQTALKIESGWTQIIGSGTTSMTKNITYPVALTTIPTSISITPLGFKSSGSTAAAITEFNSTASNILSCQATNVSTTGFTLSVFGNSAFGAAYHGFSWTLTGV